METKDQQLKPVGAARAALTNVTKELGAAHDQIEQLENLLIEVSGSNHPSPCDPMPEDPRHFSPDSINGQVEDIQRSATSVNTRLSQLINLVKEFL